MFFDKPKILFEEIKQGKRFFIEQLKNVVYLYITSTDFSKIYGSPIWLQNLSPAPVDFEIDRMDKGIPTRMPARHCKNINGEKKAFKYSFKWEENFLFVLADNRLISVVFQPFEDPQAFHTNIIGETRYGSEMPKQMLEMFSKD